MVRLGLLLGLGLGEELGLGQGLEIGLGLECWFDFFKVGVRVHVDFLEFWPGRLVP